MRLFVSYSHTGGFGNCVLTFPDETKEPENYEDIQWVQDLIRSGQDKGHPIILWWKVLEAEKGAQSS